MAISLKENYLKSIYLDYADEYQIFIIIKVQEFQIKYLLYIYSKCSRKGIIA